ncbi:MAG: hypothetical protein IKC58_03965 [Clostridia bacterium]|nr:hypothetical protein [Clostridia bacterium]
MKIRTKSYGDANMVGKRVEEMRKQRGIKQKDFIAKLQTMGCDINPTSYSKLASASCRFSCRTLEKHGS